MLDTAEVAPAALSLEGVVMNANASFSVLNGMVTAAPDSSPSVTRETLAPGYFLARPALALVMSAGLKPDTDPLVLPCIREVGNRNFRPTFTLPSALKLALVS